MPTPFEFAHDIELPGPPILTWYAVSTALGLGGWYMPMPPQRDSPMVTEWSDNERLTMDIPVGIDGSFHRFDYQIDPIDENRTRLRFEHSGEHDWSDDERELTGEAWDQYLFTLQRFLTEFAHLVPAYIEAEAPNDRTDDEGWAGVLAALGLDASESDRAPLVGTPVTIERDGLEPLVGEIDYVTEHFIGVRAGDALIRFHGRWPIDLPIAVSHYRYLDPDNREIDLEGERVAWVRWLDEATADAADDGFLR